MSNRKVLFVVDAQKDFMPGGSLAVNKGDEIVPVINELLKKGYDDVVFSQDFHPEEHTSFASTYGVDVGTVINEERKWPDHCVQGTGGAELHEGIIIPVQLIDSVGIQFVEKGTDKDSEEYSAVKSKYFKYVKYLFNKDTDVDIVGLATDFCVKETAIDIKEQTGANVTVLLEGCRGVDGELTAAAIDEMKAKDIVIV